MTFRPVSFYIHTDKITKYLLDINHKRGGTKAKFFIGWGFDPSFPDVLAKALIDHPTPTNFVRESYTGYGFHYIYEGPIRSPKGSTRIVRTIWEVVNNDTRGRLITAYPFGP